MIDSHNWATYSNRGPSRGAGGRWRGLAGNTQTISTARLEAAARPAGPGRPTSRRAELKARSADGERAGRPRGGRRPGGAQNTSDATSCADGSRAGRCPPAHTAARPTEQNARRPGTPKGRVPKYPPLTQPLPRRGSGRMDVSPGDGDASTGTCRQRRPLPGQPRRSGRRSRCGRGPSSAWWPGRRARRNRSSRR